MIVVILRFESSTRDGEELSSPDTKGDSGCREKAYSTS